MPRGSQYNQSHELIGYVPCYSLGIFSMDYGSGAAMTGVMLTEVLEWFLVLVSLNLDK
jgi:hypothetical protein